MATVSPALDLAGQHPLALAALFVVGLVASAINAVAGGGSLLSFPLLVALGVPPLSANATNSVALWPGSLASAFGFRDQLARTQKHLKFLVAPTIAGSLLGAWLLTHTPERLFDFVVPLLVLTATLLLAFGQRLRKAVLARRTKIPVALGMALQFFVSVYGGYFGAGMGILMLALLGLIATGDIHRHNAIKNTLGLFINFTASVIFVSKGLVQFVPCLALMAGAIVGGYAAAHMSQKVAADPLRKGIVVYGFVMAAWFAWRAFGG